VAEIESLWSHRETARFLRIPEQTLYYMNYAGTAPTSYKVGRHRRYDPADVRAWLKLRKSGGAE
jgi:predicted DNA-binding transcriptional regulator AlpA